MESLETIAQEISEGLGNKHNHKELVNYLLDEEAEYCGNSLHMLTDKHFRIKTIEGIVERYFEIDNPHPYSTEHITAAVKSIFERHNL